MRLRIALGLLIIALGTTNARAQSSWAAHTRTGEYAFARGDLDRAETEFQAALGIAQGFPAGDPRVETSLLNLARLYEHRSDFNRSQPMYQLLLAAQEARLETDDPALLGTLYALARVSQPVGDVPTVEDCLQRYAAIAEASGEADPRRHWQALQMLAKMQTIQERPDEALAWQRRAVQIVPRDDAATAEERIALLESLAEMELAAGNGPEAERLYLEVVELRAGEGEADALPKTMALGAETALAAGELQTAERLAALPLKGSPDVETELEARKVLAEISWIEVNRGTDDMAHLLAAAGDGEELDRARDRLQSLAAVETGDRRTSLARLAQIEALRGQPAAAAEWQRQLLDVVANDAEAAASARRNLVTLLAAAGRFDEALAENEVILTGLEARYGPSDRRLLPILDERRELLERAGQKKAAKKVRKRMRKLSRQF